MHLTSSTLLTAVVPAALLSAAANAQPAAEGGRKFSVELTGEAEVNAAGVPNQGDLDGTGSASVTINPGQERLCYAIDVAGIAAPTRGHIHRAPAGANGPIVVTFFEAAAVDLEACVPITRQLALDIIRDPDSFYVNVHNADFPAGALRGQLSK